MTDGILSKRRSCGAYHQCAATIFMVSLSGCAVAPKEMALGPERRQLNVAAFDEVWTTIRDTHWDPNLGGLDWEALRDQYRPRVESAEYMSEARRAIGDLIAELKQTHFSVIPAELLDDEETAEGAGQRDGGTGIDVRVVDEQALVVSVDEGSPAEKLGIKPGWIIVRVDDRLVGPRLAKIRDSLADDSTIGDMRMARAVTSRLYGLVGETVEVEFLDAEDRGHTHNIKLTPRRGKKVQLGLLPPFYLSFESRRIGAGIGYIAFDGFMDPLRIMGGYNEAITDFMDADGLIIDLRGNPGGIGAMAMGMAGWLIAQESQYLGTMKTRTTELKFVVNPRATTFRGPVVVLVDGLTGSTAEIFSGGLKDLGRATIVGSRTAGAALPAQLKKLPNGDGLLYAVANYVSEGGGVLEGKGVIPHIEAPLTREALLAGRDPALEEAIAVINGQRGLDPDTKEFRQVTGAEKR